MELDSISQPELDRIEQFGNADLVIGILNGNNPVDGSAPVDLAEQVLAGLSGLSASFRTMVVCNNGASSPSSSPSGNGSGNHVSNTSSMVSWCSLPVPGPAETHQQIISNAYRRVFAVASKLGVRACGVIVSRSQVTAGWRGR